MSHLVTSALHQPCTTERSFDSKLVWRSDLFFILFQVWIHSVLLSST